MNKKGFTFIELLAVIALIAIVMLLVVPNVIGLFNGGINESMKVEEDELKQAGKLYLEDTCKNPVLYNTCTLVRNEDYTFSGRINLSELINEEYISNIKYKSTICEGYVDIDHNEVIPYLSCGEEGGKNYETEGYINE